MTTQAQKIWDLINTGWKVSSKMVAQHLGFKITSVSTVFSVFNKLGFLNIVEVGKHSLIIYEVKPEFKGKEYKETIEPLMHKYWTEKDKKYKEADKRKRERQVKEKFIVPDTEYWLINEFRKVIEKTPRSLALSRIKKLFEEALNTF